MIKHFILLLSLVTYAWADKPAQLPEFTQQTTDSWINSQPLSVKDLLGSVVLIDVWTYSCWNCYRSFPWLNDLEMRYQHQPFRVVGIHSPEFESEKRRFMVEQKAKQFQLHHPIMIDNDHAYWRALNNKYWPAYYLVDKKGVIRYRFVGETHKKSRRAKHIEQAIHLLLSE